MSSIDERIVSMKFNNGQFLNGIKSTLSALTGLKNGLKLDGATQGLENLNQAGSRFSLANLGAGVEGVSGKFVALATIGITALTNITNKAIDAGTRIAKSLTIDPIKQGLEEYETNLNSIQTILANTQASGSTLTDVNSALQELNHYSDQTIYNFSEMARNIGTFTAAGVNLETSTSSIKGIANLAALSGSNSQQAATAMYQLSQAISSGKVSLMDWNSVVNAGMGGTVFQRALAETAVAMGELDASTVKLEGDMKNVKIAGESFRDSISAEGGGPSWLSAEVLTTTLGQFTGDLTEAELAAQGFNEAQIKAIQETAKTAKSAATEVKTISQLMGTLKEAAGSGWSQTWQLVIGDFEEAKSMWTSVNNTLSGMIGASADARNAIVKDWKELGGRDAAMKAFQNGFEAIMSVVKPIKEALSDIFPPATGEQLFVITKHIREFTEGLKLSAPAAEGLKSTFRGIFAVLDIGFMILKAAASMFAGLFGGFGEGTESVLDFTGGIGEFLVSLRDAIKAGDGLTTFFGHMGTGLEFVINMFKNLGNFIADIFGEGIDTGGMDGSLDRLQKRIEPLTFLADKLASVWGAVGEKFKQVWAYFQPMAAEMGTFFAGIGKSITDAVSNMDYTAMLDTINTGLFAGIVLMMKKWMSGGFGGDDGGGGFFDQIKETLGGVTDTLSAMQAQLKATALIKIAGAIALLAVSITILALIDPAKLGPALAAIAIMFAQLAGSLVAFNAAVGLMGAIKMPFIAASLILLATAVVILASAVRMLSSLSWEELAKGLAGVTVLLAALAGTAKLLSASSGGLIRASAGLILVAVAVKILASAVEDFAQMDWAEMARGFAGVGAALLALGLFTKLAATGKSAVAQGAGLILLAVALKLIASAVGDFAGMDWETLGRGFAGMGGALLLIAGAMHLMPKNMIITAGALVIVAGALIVVAGALRLMAGMSWEEVGRGLTVLAASLLILAGAMYLMTGAIVGAAALVIVAGALAILAPILVMLGDMSWEEIARGLAVLAGAFLVLGLAGLLLTPVVPTLLLLGVAITLIGAGLALAGVGVLAFAIGLTALSASVVIAGAAIVGLVSMLIGLIPFAMTSLAQGITAFASIIGNSAPIFMASMAKLMMALLMQINRLAPAIVQTLQNLLMLMVNTLVRAVPILIAKGLQMLLGILTGIANNIGRIVTVALLIITNFINGISAGLPRLVQAGINLIITFVNSLANGIRANSDRMNAAGRNLAAAIISGMTAGIRGGVGTIISAAKGMAQSALSAAKSALGINSPSKEFHKVGEWSGEGMVDGLVAMSGAVGSAAAGVGDTALSSLKNSMANVGKGLSADMNLNPTIRPVLDLSNVRKGSSDIDGLLTPSAISAEESYGKAAAIAHDNRATQQAMAEDTFGSSPAETQVVFNQYNQSPTALSAATIYRQTNNQISKIRGGLPRR